MTRMYKLVSQNWTTHGDTFWSIEKTNVATEVGNTMCTNQVLHCYASPDEAVLFNPIHAGIMNPILLEIECSEIINNDSLKYACKEQTPIRQLELPIWNTNERVAFAIKVALEIYEEPLFVSWAKDWLSNKDRSHKAAAKAAAYAAADAAYAAADAAYAAKAAAYAAKAAAYAAKAAAYAAAADHAYAAEIIKKSIHWVKTEFKG